MISVHALVQSGMQRLFHARSLSLSASRRILQRLVFIAVACLLLDVSLHAQTIDDGIMLSQKTLFAGALYSHDSWDHYWEGTLNRVNGNLGTVTTQATTFAGNYGLTNRLNLIASAPYVWTNASQGVLRGQKGFQDLTLAAKYNALQAPVGQFGTLRVIGLVYGGLPLTDYTPDLEPLSLGSHSKRISLRPTVNFQGGQGLYLNGSMAYTWRDNVKLDRSSYFTNGQLFLSNEVAMPNVFDYTVSGGYRKNSLMVIGSFTQQQTRGGGDIRRQDLPFVSNRDNFSKAGGLLMYALPKVRNLQYQFAYANVFDGRNVGQSSTFTTGLMYTLHFERRGSK